MRRRIKLIVSVLSLALSMGLAMYGVYAATARTTTISGTIQFKTDNVRATVQVYEYFGNGPHSESDLITTLTFAYEAAVTQTAQLGSKVSSTSNGDINMGTDTVYSFVVKITNNFTAGNITVALPTLAGITGLDYTAPTNSTTTIQPGAANAQTYIYKYTLNPATLQTASISHAISATYSLTVA